MAMFITLTLAYNNKPVHINVDCVTAFYQTETPQHSYLTRVEVVGAGSEVWEVKETPKEIAIRIDEAASRQTERKVETLEKMVENRKAMGSTFFGLPFPVKLALMANV